MRIREIVFNNVRAFRGEHRISFVDELTEQANPTTVIAGTNGTGKTTILDTIDLLVRFELVDHPLYSEIVESGFAAIQLELTSDDLLDQDSLNYPKTLWLAVGCKELNSHYATTIKEDVIIAGQNSYQTEQSRQIENLLNRAMTLMAKGEQNLHGGLIYFPQNRQPFLSPSTPRGIQPPLQNRQWASRVTPKEDWETSLESFFVWQNYLDLEANAHKISSARLKTFVKEIETVLGKDRPITISQGRVYIPASWSRDGKEPAKIRLDQLPSGEKQCLWMLGELARCRREGGVILIDEPEASLHPTLQRMLVYQLQNLAREWNCQLILATHSLEIMRSVHSSKRINLDHLEHSSESGEASYEEAA